jgi:hypothetical protein
MKPSRDEREKLVDMIRQQRAKLSLTNAQLALIADVDPGQTSRIVEGKFRTLSGNVLRICNVLGVDPVVGTPAVPSPREVQRQAAWAKLEASVRRAWDRTPKDADRLVAVIDAVAQVKAPKRKRVGTDGGTAALPSK